MHFNKKFNEGSRDILYSQFTSKTTFYNNLIIIRIYETVQLNYYFSTLVLAIIAIGN